MQALNIKAPLEDVLMAATDAADNGHPYMDVLIPDFGYTIQAFGHVTASKVTVLKFRTYSYTDDPERHYGDICIYLAELS